MLLLYNILTIFSFKFKAWNERFKQILKKWQALPKDKKAPYIHQARENRTNNVRLKKVPQVCKKIN